MCGSRQYPDRRDEAGSLEGLGSDSRNLGKAKRPTQIILLSLTHSPYRFSFHSWEIPSDLWLLMRSLRSTTLSLFALLHREDLLIMLFPVLNLAWRKDGSLLYFCHTSIYY